MRVYGGVAEGGGGGSVLINIVPVDGATANGDIEATLIVVDGKETAPMPQID